MKVGDSFFLANEAGAMNMVAAASLYGKHHKKRFITRKAFENGVAGRRCWRVELLGE